METPGVLFLVINYFNEAEVIRFITLLSWQNYKVYKVIVVNNGSNDINKLNELIASFPKVKIYYPKSNLGYYPAAHYGLRSFMEENKALPDHVIVCNTDINILNPDFLTNLMKSVGDVKGPSIISTKNYRDSF